MQMTAAAMWINAYFYSFDISVTTFVHRLYDISGPFFSGFFDFISLLGKGGIVLILVSFGLILNKSTRKVGTVMILGLGIGALFTNCFFKIIVARPRPYLDTNSIYYQFWVLVGQRTESDKSFPSGHTCAAFAAMTGIFLTCDKKYSWTAFIFAFLMGLARIYLCVHYPSDVLGGIIVGSGSSVIAYFVSAKIPDIYYEIDFIRKKRGRHEKLT